MEPTCGCTAEHDRAPYLTHVNLAGDTVRDLIAALKLLDPDTKTEINKLQAIVSPFGEFRARRILTVD